MIKFSPEHAALLIAALNDDPDGLLFGAKVGLFTNFPDLSLPDLETSDFDVPTWDAYATQTCVWTAGVDAAGNPIMVTPPKVFSAPDEDGLPVDIVGAIIVNAAGEYVAAGYFGSTVRVALPLQQLHVTPIIPIADSSDDTIEAALA